VTTNEEGRGELLPCPFCRVVPGVISNMVIPKCERPCLFYRTVFGATPEQWNSRALPKEVVALNEELARLRAEVERMKNHDEKIRKSISETFSAENDRLRAEVERLNNQIEQARNYVGLEGYGCFLCTYKDGVYIRSCVPHQQLAAKDAEIERLVRAIGDSAMTEGGKKSANELAFELLKAELSHLRESCRGALILIESHKYDSQIPACQFAAETATRALAALKDEGKEKL
jgi:hypothetical protein